jgi:hypothetical protein
MRLLRYSLLVALIGALLLPGGVLSKTPPSAIIEDCSDDGELQGDYSASEKAEARRKLPADLSQYNDCLELLSAGGSDRGRGLQGAGLPGGSPGAGAPSAADDAAARQERAAIEALAGATGRPTLSLDGKTIRPGDAGLYDLASATHQPPLPVTLALVATALLTLAGLALAGRRRLLAAGVTGVRSLPAPLHRVPGLRR